MYPRGSFKSTIDGIDIVQWILNFPDIRIFILTGNYDLAESFIYEIREYFTLAEGGDPTLFQELFPEFCISSKGNGSKLEYRCPAAHLGLKEPTIWINSIDSATSGWHCDILKCDDVVTDKNAEIPTRRESVIATFDKKRYLVDQPFGYIDVIGTRYAPDDLYGVMLERNEVSDEKDLKYLCDAAWRVKIDALKKDIRELTEADVDLLFPERLTFKVLRKDLMLNETEFRCQRLNEPVFAASQIFDLDVLKAALRPPSSFPDKGDIYITWDTAHSTGPKSNFSCCVVAKRDDQDRLFILDIICEKLKADELEYRVAQMASMWSPSLVLIEQYPGYEHMKMGIQRNAMSMHVPLNIDYFPIDNGRDAKLNRVRALQPLIKTGRLFFSSTIDIIDATFKQFITFTGQKHRTDDIPDAISFLLRTLPDSLSYRELSIKEQEMKEKAKADGLYNMLFPDQPIITEQQTPDDEVIYNYINDREI